MWHLETAMINYGHPNETSPKKKIKAQDNLSVCPRVESIRMNKRHVAELVIQKSLLLNFWNLDRSTTLIEKNFAII